MKNLVQKLDERLRVALGRKLTQEQMKNAEVKGENKGFTIITGSDKPLNIDRLEKDSSGEFVRFRQRFELMDTPDASEGWAITHTGYYPSKTTMDVYDGDGLLKSRTVSYG